MSTVSRQEKSGEKIGVILMTYGSATTAEHVREYFTHIYGDKVSETTIQDFENRYRLVGHSPLIEITQKQAELLEENLGENYVVRAGMRHSHPFIEEAMGECIEAGAKKIVGIILSPQFSSFIMEGYKKDFTAAALKYGLKEGDFTVAPQWPTEEHFIELLAQRIAESLEKLQKEYGKQIPVIFTTHSLPQRVVEKDPSYLDQLTATIDAVRAKLHQKPLFQNLEWYAAYQSAGHTPEEWLKPDLTDILQELAQKNPPLRPNSAKASMGKQDSAGREAVLIAPIQFLTDHLEILYDLDIAARQQCLDVGLSYNRIELPNTHPLFIEALKALTRVALK
jgi:ferrochelatase